MSTQKGEINKDRARRRVSGILAEAELMRRIGWRIGFVSGGYGAYTLDELIAIIKRVKEIHGEATWLNVGVLSGDELSEFEGIIEGVVGSVETVNKDLHKRICPGKPLEQVETMFKDSKERGFKNGMNIILGVGEGIEEMQISLEEPSVLKTVAEGNSFYLGPIPETETNQELISAIGGRPPIAAILVPISIMGKVVNILYVDGGEKELGDTLLDIQRLATKASMAFEILILKNKIMMT